jgi:hypothetical protein
MPSRHNRNLRSVIALTLACVYLLFAAGASVGLAHERLGSPCHGHTIAVSDLSGLGEFAVHPQSDIHAAQGDDSGTAGHPDSVCQFCSAIVSDAGPIAPRVTVISITLEHRGSSYFGLPPAPLPRPPQSLIAL